ncbi:xanthine dehydrogenase family protein molybdopterin-binding subunit [Streptomyces sp. HNM0575]|uniref:xanthine dehydrogenase family protein molybdopterin-binding subunit n=1 Tax=Streptomyces sp. HNM0575 TaxID=2716338 RepID=UPI00145E488D|nr:xanthine dehydrogenase family protein molybdopterin-binding subunit [Streptomyces sp. HNM0575]NLU73103.1 xanthine dehydrogenase family protein molybdopterin-binding subunit [Streptomyces sp. HNM0575]
MSRTDAGGAARASGATRTVEPSQPLKPLDVRSVGSSPQRLDGPEKVTGTAPYAWEHPLPSPLYVHPLQAAVARGRILTMDTGAAEALDGVLAVLTPYNAPRLADTDDAELAVLQSEDVAFRGQLIGAVIAETPETAGQGAAMVDVEYEQHPHDTELSTDRTDLYRPEVVNPTYASDTEDGDPEAALAAAPVTVDVVYSTPMEHNNPMEPHTCVAVWERSEGRDPGGPDGSGSSADSGPLLTLYDSTQGAHQVKQTLAPLFGLPAESVRVISPHVGGGFGSKGMPHAHNVLAVLAAKVSGGRPVKLALTRQQMFSLAGYRTPTVQRLRLGADTEGRLTALCHDVVEQTSKIKEFAEQTGVASRMMYAADNRSTSHRLAALDVPVPSWMRAPGEAPGMFAAESAMDELAVACGIDPIDLRERNDPETDPESGRPWSGRHLVRCLRTGAERFGWDRRAEPGTRREGDWLIGLGVASATYPSYAFPGSVAEIERRTDGDGASGGYAVRIGVADIGTGTWTALSQIAADALNCPFGEVHLEIGDTALPPGTVAGGSSGINSWGSAVVAASRAFREEYGDDPAPGSRIRAGMPSDPELSDYSAHSFGAQFAEVRVHAYTGEVRVARMLGVFSAGRIVNPRTARSQFMGGMIMGMSMALFEESVFDHGTGHVVNHDFAQYHIPACADVLDIDAVWLDEPDMHANPMGAKGIGEIGIVGSPAAVVNAVHNATGIRVRDLPVTPDKLLRS